MAPVRENDEGEVAPDEEGPTMSMEFLQYNTVILHEMANCWGLKPKIGKGRIQKEVEVFYGYVGLSPTKNQSYRDAWTLKRLWGYACRREKDACKRRQTPRDL
ncbi:unnamed protein product [Durusdinium trenchii]|uniref:Uncharacterized protein n=1 Tax=Durusdinium trenchii TaxID=1381693 RepID=A0ABP0SCJ3_9DINO